MALIKFYRGASGVTLPSFQDGAVFIVANGSRKDNINLGDMYVDVSNDNQSNQRLHIIPKDAIYYKTQTDWEDSQEWTETSIANRIYVKIVVNGDTRTPYIAVGNGQTQVGLLTFKQMDATYAASNATPSEVQTTAWAGSSADYARADHIHNITTATITTALGYTPARPDDIPSGAMRYRGTTTFSITDGATTNPTDIYTGTNTRTNGDVVISGEKEFVWNGSKWQEFGSTGSLKALAFKDNATASYKPAGTLTITLPTASKNVVSSITTGTAVSGVTTAAQTMVTGVTTAAQTVATGGSATSITVSGEVLNIPASVITSVATTSINKVTAVSTVSKNVVSSVSTGTVVTDVTTAAQTVVTGQPTTKTFTGTTATITVS